MARADQTEINLRIVIENPVVGVMLSLQDKTNKPVGAVTPGKKPVVFDFPVRVGPDPKTGVTRFYGEYVRAEGPERRFFYVCIGQGAGQKGTPFSRRMKINIHDIPQGLIDKAIKGKALEASVNGTGKDGTPACASVPVVGGWRAV